MKFEFKEFKFCNLTFEIKIIKHFLKKYIYIYTYHNIYIIIYDVLNV